MAPSARRTVVIGFVTAAIVVPIAFALAYAMRFVFPRRANLILQLALISLFSGYLVRIYAWRTILGKQGLLNSALQWLGVTDAPLEFLIYSNFATVVTLTGLLLPDFRLISVPSSGDHWNALMRQYPAIISQYDERS